jgi:lipoyl(octanoyl) transferase
VYAVACGEVAYDDALRWQHLLVDAREAGDIDDVLLTLSHPPTYTAGRRADVAAHVRRSPATAHIPVVRVDRGGDVTYHGPGQLVAYPILRLPHAKAVRAHVEALEQAVVRVAASFGVAAAGATGGAARGSRPPTGVWVGDEKLAAIGIKVTGHTTSHGLALNVDPDLTHFAGIVPCGIDDAGVCSLASLGVDTTMEQVELRLVAVLAEALDRPIQRVSPAALGLTPAAAPRVH